MNWQRARNPDQKAERVDAILTAAGTLFDERELPDISMRDVATHAGLGKASLYHYFKTKEEVFISLYQSEVEGWRSDVSARLKRLRSPNPGRIAKVLTEVLRERTRFCRLTVVFSSVLEHNLSPDFIREFKLSLQIPLGQFSLLLQELQPQLTEEMIREFLFQHHAVIAGLWPLAHPSPEVSEVLKEECFNQYGIDFFSVFHRTMEKLLSE